MNFKKIVSMVTLCAVTTMAGALPAFAEDTAAVVADSADTAAIVTYSSNSSANLSAAASGISAVAAQVTGQSTPTTTTTTQATQPATESQTAAVTAEAVKAYDYVSLESPAVTIDGKTYLPLRATFAALSQKAMNITWKAEGQYKLRLTGSEGDFEVYITSDSKGLQLSKGGETYAFENVDGVGYVPLAFFQDIIMTATLGLSGDNILVVADITGNDVWNNPESFWGNMNTYTSPVVETPTATTTTTAAATPTVTVPTVTVPSVSTPAATTTTTTTTASTAATKPATSTSTSSSSSVSFIWPTTVTYISSNFGYRQDPFGGVIGDFHLGLDIAGPEGTPVYASAAGTVIRASWFDSYGNCVDIQHANGMITRYAHLSAYHVSVGDTVSQGQLIADIGATGNVTGAHLHFETLVNGSEVDPLGYVSVPN